MQLTDEERLGMIAAQQLDPHLEDEDQHFRGGEGRITLQLTDRQAQILAACALCSRPLKWRSVKPALETGEVHPPDLCCRRCWDDEKRPLRRPGEALKAARRILARIERAGLTEHYEGVAHDAFMRRQNRQN